MDSGQNEINRLLQSMGWSPDELIARVQKLATKPDLTSESPNSTTESNKLSINPDLTSDSQNSTTDTNKLSTKPDPTSDTLNSVTDTTHCESVVTPVENSKISDNTNSEVVDLLRLAPETSEEVPQTSEEVSKTSEEIPKTSEEVPKTSEEVPKVSEEVPKTSEEVLLDDQSELVCTSNDEVTVQNSEDSNSRKDECQLIPNKCENERTAGDTNSETEKTVQDHDYSNFITDDERDVSTTNEEDLRMIIKQQLSTLRNMKKNGTFLSNMERKHLTSCRNVKKKKISCHNIDSTSVDEKKVGSPGKMSDGNENSLISLSEETDILIKDVTGGVDRLSEDESINVVEEERRFASISGISFLNNCVLSVPTINHQTSNCISPLSTENIKCYTNTKLALPQATEKLIDVVDETSTNILGSDHKVLLKNNEKSPFISDSLEDFLNESAQLKISYAIPKLGAEEGLAKVKKSSPYENIFNKTNTIDFNMENRAPQKEKTKRIKAKTVAEMRRYMEKIEWMKRGIPGNSSENNEVEEKNPKIQTLPRLSDDEQDDELLIRTRTSIQPTSRIIPSHRNNFIMYKNKKLWVSCKSNNPNNFITIIGKPRRRMKKKIKRYEEPCVKKLSLLSTLNKSKPSTIKYKPGPLCKKPELQNLESRNKWSLELKTLPKIYLEVFPEFGKPIDPDYTHLLPMFENTVISELRCDYALTALKTKNETETKSFKFHVPYQNNQQQIVVKKPFKLTSAPPKVTIIYHDEDPTEGVRSVIDGLLNYVEVKEISDSLIKDDDVVFEKEPNDINCNVNKMKPRKHRRSKIEMELLRLNCKVIDVATNANENNECGKSYCKMGCVCNSLLCDSLFSNHCQLVDCMFECKCPSYCDNNETTGNLSAHTVTNLEDRAKKNLAKVEREFTQTLIHTDEDVILVGTGGRNKTRASKLPKKFTDYVDDEYFIYPRGIVPGRDKLPIKFCRIDLVRINCDDIIPYCLFHNMYNCYCKGNAVDFAPQIPKIRIIKEEEDWDKPWYESCARIREVFPQYVERNKHPEYNEKLRLKNSRHLSKSRVKVVEPDEVDITFEKWKEPSVARNVRNPSKGSKRKQSFDIIKNNDEMSIDDKVYTKQRRKYARKRSIETKTVEKHTKYYQIFEGEIRVSLKDNQDMLQIIGPENSSLEYLRILSWNNVIKCFRARKMNIWSKDSKSSVLLCNAPGYLPPKAFMDIRKVMHRSEIVEWILTDSLPSDRPRERMHLILTPRKNHFLISGYCLKTGDSAKSVETTNTSATSTSAESETTKSENQDQLQQFPNENQSLQYPDGLIHESENLARESTNSLLNAGLKNTRIKPNLLDASQEQKVISKPIRIINSEVLPTNINQGGVLGIPVPRYTLKSKPSQVILTGETGSSNTRVEYLSLADILEPPNNQVQNNPVSRLQPAPSTQKEKWPLSLQELLSTKPINVDNSTSDVILLDTNKSEIDANVLKTTSDIYIKNNTFKTSNISKIGKTLNRSDTINHLPPKSTLVKSKVNAKQMQLVSTIKKLEARTDLKPLQSTSGAKTETTSTEIEKNALNSSIFLPNTDSTQKSTDCPKVREVAEQHAENNGEGKKNTDEFNQSSSTKDVTLVCYKNPHKSSKPIETVSAVSLNATAHLYRKNKLIPKKATNNIINSKLANIVTYNPMQLTELKPPISTVSKNFFEANISSLNSGDAVTTLGNTNYKTTKILLSKPTRCAHKDIDNNSKMLLLSNHKFSPRRLYLSRTDFDVSSSVRLPRIEECYRWRMVYLNSDFSYLSFNEVDYSIKYTDLLNVVNMAHNLNLTVTLRNKDFCLQFKHPIFGIFCVPDYQDRLIIGPYLENEELKFETLRYLTGKLIDTTTYTKFFGKSQDDSLPRWLYDIPKSKIRKSLIIDITEDDYTDVIDGSDDDICIVEETSSGKDVAFDRYLAESLLVPPFVEILTAEELKSRRINRYIVTNIPHLGYFHGHQEGTDPDIEIFWPGNAKGFRFQNISLAKEALTVYLSQIFCCVPKDFKLRVIILTNIDQQHNKPIDPKYFSERKHYICGDFGIYAQDAVPMAIINDHQISSVDDLITSVDRMEENDYKLLKYFGLFLMSKEEIARCKRPDEILQWTISEIYVLKKLSENYEAEKADLLNILRRKKIADEKNNTADESINLDEESSFQEPTETIEIVDSDADDEISVTKIVQDIPSNCVLPKRKLLKPKFKKIKPLLKPQFQMTYTRSLRKISEQEMQNSPHLNSNLKMVFLTKTSKLHKEDVKLVQPPTNKIN